VFLLNEFFFVKIFHAIIFGLATGVAIPYALQSFFKIQVSTIRKLIFVVSAFCMLHYTHIFDQVMIDLPSFGYFSAALAFALKLKSGPTLARKIMFGLFAGLAFCGSGQYSIAALCLLAYALVNSYSKTRFLANSQRTWPNKALSALPLLFPFFALKIADLIFQQTFVAPLKSAGAWIPTGTDWLQYGLAGTLGHLRLFFGPNLKSPKGQDLIRTLPLEQQQQLADGGSISFSSFLEIVLQHPIDYATVLLGRLIVVLGADNGSFSLFFLICAYLSIGFTIQTFRRAFSSNILSSSDLLALMAILSTLIAPLILHVEARYGTTITAFSLAVAAFSAFKDFDLRSAALSRVTNENSYRSHIGYKMLLEIRFPALVCILGILLFGLAASSSEDGVSTLFIL
jgi:hypothetical protein